MSGSRLGVCKETTDRAKRAMVLQEAWAAGRCAMVASFDYTAEKDAALLGMFSVSKLAGIGLPAAIYVKIYGELAV